MTEKNYRPCVGIMLINAKGKVFVAKRIDTRSEAWQMPQGGIDEGEDITSAALRELEEETSITNVQILAQSKEWLKYDLPERLIAYLWDGQYHGQKQQWFLMKFLGDDSQINIETEHPEFSEWRWEDPRNVPKLIVPFKTKLYEDIIEEFLPHIDIA